MPPTPRALSISRLGLTLTPALFLFLAACNAATAPTTAPEVRTQPSPVQPTLVSRGPSRAVPAATAVATVPAGDVAHAPAQMAPLPRPKVYPKLRAMRSPEYGIQAFMWWRPELAERDMLVVKDMGFGWIKQGFGWRDIELAKGKFDWSHTDHIVGKIQEYGGLKLLVRVDQQPNCARSGCALQGPPARLQDYGDFLTAVATRYKGKIAAYQIWNEPNLAREWCGQSPNPRQYAEMLAVAYAAIKKVDPNAYVISAGLSPTGTQPPEAMPDEAYLDQLYQAIGGSGDGFFDLLGVHAAGFAASPETSPETAAADKALGGERFFAFRHVEDLRKIQTRYGDTDRQVAILEMGWSSDAVHPAYAWHRVSEQTKADYLVRAYQYAAKNWAPWIGLMSAIYICNPDWTQNDEQYWWCVTNPDGTPRPAFRALKAMAK
jgi:hypothetical protein